MTKPQKVNHLKDALALITAARDAITNVTEVSTNPLFVNALLPADADLAHSHHKLTTFVKTLEDQA